MNLTFLAFETVDSWFPSGLYSLQLNPSEFEVAYLSPEDEKCEINALGQYIESSEPVFTLKTWNLKFTIDNTGAVQMPPPAFLPILVPGLSVYPSISYFNSLFVEPDDEVHSRKYIKGIWGNGFLQIFGRVTDFKYTYTFFDSYGTPLRAECTLTIREVPSNTLFGSLFKSPDITRMPMIKEGDNLVSMCDKFYDNKNYYTQVAQQNNLASFRRLKPGQNLTFPPIEK